MMWCDALMWCIDVMQWCDVIWRADVAWREKPRQEKTRMNDPGCHEPTEQEPSARMTRQHCNRKVVVICKLVENKILII